MLLGRRDYGRVARDRCECPRNTKALMMDGRVGRFAALRPLLPCSRPVLVASLQPTILTATTDTRLALYQSHFVSS